MQPNIDIAEYPLPQSIDKQILDKFQSYPCIIQGKPPNQLWEAYTVEFEDDTILASPLVQTVFREYFGVPMTDKAARKQLYFNPDQRLALLKQAKETGHARAECPMVGRDCLLIYNILLFYDSGAYYRLSRLLNKIPLPDRKNVISPEAYMEKHVIRTFNEWKSRSAILTFDITGDRQHVTVAEPFLKLFETYFCKQLSDIDDITEIYLDPDQRDRMDDIAKRQGICREDVYLVGCNGILLMDVVVWPKDDKPVRHMKFIEELPLKYLDMIKKIVVNGG